MSFTLLKDNIQYIWNVKLGRRGQVWLALLAGVSISLFAGYLLGQRRRRYRAVAPKHSTLHRNNTFKETISQSQDAVEVFSEQESAVVGSQTLAMEPSSSTEETDYETGSVSSEDSFHSTVDDLNTAQSSPIALYVRALDFVSHGTVSVRTMRTQMLQCSSDNDFLAKVYCARLAFDHLLKSPDHRTYFMSVTQNLMSEFLQSAGEDPLAFCAQFEDLVEFLQREGSWNTAVEELTERGVQAMNVYDIGVDFVLLDAFDDLERPPSAFLSVLQNRWITSGMKRSALSAALWSVLKAKKGMLKHKDGFMSRFYCLSETITPALAWGFLGTDTVLKNICVHFKAIVLKFIRSVFSLEDAHYSCVEELAEDVLRLAKEAADAMRTLHPQN